MRALILSDIHGNLEALNAVLEAAAGLYDTVWNLGDMVGYGASPNQVIDIIRPLAALNVRGNHDRVCCGLTSALGFNPVARAAALWTKDELTPDEPRVAPRRTLTARSTPNTPPTRNRLMLPARTVRRSTRTTTSSTCGTRGLRSSR